MSKKKSVKNDTLANDKGRKAAASCWLYLLCLQRGYNTNAINVIFFPSGWFILQMHDRTMPFLVTDLKKKREWEKAGSKSNFAYCFHVFFALFLWTTEKMCQIEYTSVSTSDTAVLCSKKILTNTCETGADDCYQNRVWDLWVECPLLWIFRSLEIHNLEEKRRRYGGGLEVG